MLFQYSDWDLRHQVLFLYNYFVQLSYELERPALENAHTLVQRTDIFSCKFSAKVSLMLDNPFLVPSLCKLNHISLCFIQISTKWPAKLLIPFRESTIFFEVIPGVLDFLIYLPLFFRISLKILLSFFMRSLIFVHSHCMVCKALSIPKYSCMFSFLQCFSYWRI